MGMENPAGKKRKYSWMPEDEARIRKEMEYNSPEEIEKRIKQERQRIEEANYRE